MSDNESSGQHVAAHPEPNYFAIFIALAVLTAAEVGIVYMGLPRAVLVVGLVGMALVKAGLVAAFFMHLKFEVKTLAMIAIVPLILCTYLLFMLIPDAI